MHDPRPRPRNVISVDVEDYFHAEAFSTIVDSAGWGSRLSHVERNTVKVLELLARLEIHGTFFVLGWVAQQYPGLVRKIAAAGHELASHSYWHRQIFRLQPQEFREDTQRAKDIVEQITGQPIYGYRAPTFSIVESSLWALEILAELGFHYDSSIFPIRHDRYGIPQAPRFPFRINTPAGSIVEYPIATFRVWGKWNMPVGGGGYLRLFPEWYTRLGVRRAEREQLPVISYIHPWELDPHQPNLHPGFTTRIRHYTNLAKTEKRLEAMLRNGNFTSFGESGLHETAMDCDISTWGKMQPNEARQVAQYWDRIAPQFDSIYSGKKNVLSRTLDRVLRRDMYQRFDWVMRKAGDGSGQQMCDVGCGSGRFVSSLAQRGARVTGLDFAPQMLALARALAEQNGVAERCSFVESDILEWNIAEKFDLVIAIGLWDYVAEPLSRLEKIRQITAGRFLSAWPRAGTWRAALRKRRLKMAGCPVYFFTRDEVEHYLRQAGFAVSSVEVYGQLFCVEAIPLAPK